LATFENCFELLRSGRCIAIFPEGISHDQPQLQKIKTGAARIALGAVSGPSPAAALKIVPVGLYYTSKTSFRSEALIRYGQVFGVDAVELEPDGEPPREAVARLTQKLEASLRDVTLNVQNNTELDAIVRAEALFSAISKNLYFRPTLSRTLELLQHLAAKYTLLVAEEPERMPELNAKLNRYEHDLKSSGVTKQGLSLLQHPRRYVLRYLVLRILLLIAFAPFAIIGAIVHLPAYLFSNLIGRIFSKHDTDIAGSSSTIVAGIGLMPLTWMIVALVLWYRLGWEVALASTTMTALCGYVALRSYETLMDLRIWLKAGWLLFRRRALFLRLLIQREGLREEVGKIAAS
jgi:glycerol-3-phosphate O-acyltransferase/dihydroxyacetone phosphate acyltransferase